MKRHRLASVLAGVLMAGALFAAVDDLPWRWDDTGRTDIAPETVGSAVNAASFDTWSFCSVRTRLVPRGLVVLIR